MKVGYVTTEEADAYVATHYVEDSDIRTYWEDLSDEDKVVLLRVSFENIERLPFPGRKSQPSQAEMFPRYPNTEVPQDIKFAQIENALTLSDTSEVDETAQYEKLWNAGVKSYRIGNLSETIGNMTYGAGNLSQSGLTSAKAKKLIIPYLGGGFSIE